MMTILNLTAVLNSWKGRWDGSIVEE